MRWTTADRTYERVDGWGNLPDGWRWGQVAGVAVDGEDNVHVFARTDHPHLVFARDGNLIDHWGETFFRGVHGIYVAADGSIFFIDHTNSVVSKFDSAGTHCFTLGSFGVHADTGFTEQIRTPPGVGDADSVPTHTGVGHSGPPFHFPTDVAVSDSGEIFVADGYRNARVHRFAPDGTLIGSWGDPGNAADLRDTKLGPAVFHTPHGIDVAGDRVYVADLENNRIQIFDLEGGYVDMWLGLSRPSNVIVDPVEGRAYVSELNDRCTILDLEGTIVGRLGEADDPDRQIIGRLGMAHDPENFWGPHSLAKDSEGSLYVAEAWGGERLLKLARTR